MREVRERVYKHTTNIVGAEESRTSYPGSSQQNGGPGSNTAFTDSLKCIQNIMDISVEIFHSLPCLRLLFIDRKYDSIFEVVQQKFSEQFYLFQCITTANLLYTVRETV